MTFPIYDENLYILHMKNDMEKATSDVAASLDGLIAGDMEKIPPLATLKQLAIAVEESKKFSSMKEMLAASADYSPFNERAGRRLSAVKSLVFQEKDEKKTLEFGDDEKVIYVIQLLFSADGSFLNRVDFSGLEGSPALALQREIHAAPPESFVVKLSEVIANFKSLTDMALFWWRVVEELRRHWSDGEHIAGIPLDRIPDLNCCPLYQQLQVINCCISRKRRHAAASESLGCSPVEANANKSTDSKDRLQSNSRPALYARISTGELVQRLGADHPSDSLLMLETGEPIYFPVTQEGPLLTEYLIKETEEFVLETGSVGAGCSQLLSDMQAFKAANPGCILEDFVRWHSPPDWTDAEEGAEADDFFDGVVVSSKRGQLSKRMQKEGNLWLQLWAAAKPIPARDQTPLFDEDLAVEGILDFLEDISPFELFRQLFVSLLALGFIIAEESLSTDDDLSKLFSQCKDYVLRTCYGSINEKVNDLCKVYETVETMLLKPEEVLNGMNEPKKPQGTEAMEKEPRRIFRIPSLIFGGGKDAMPRKCEPEGEQKSEGRSTLSRSISSFFSRKSSFLYTFSF